MEILQKIDFQNLYDRKLDIVLYFAPLAAFDLRIRIVEQVRFFSALETPFLRIMRQRVELKVKKRILWSKFRIFKIFLKVVLGM